MSEYSKIILFYFYTGINLSVAPALLALGSLDMNKKFWGLSTYKNALTRDLPISKNTYQ
jgi:hypothetical protein